MTRWQTRFNKSFGAKVSGVLGIRVPAFRCNNFVNPEISELTKLIYTIIGTNQLISFVLGIFDLK
jgi:hypothetical protein